jgi:hypothetical protein
MTRSMKFAGRLLASVVVVWIGSACGGNISVPAPLLAEGFNGTFPGANWTTPGTTGTTTTQIIGVGNPAPGLSFSAGANNSSSTTTTTAAFNNPSLSISFQEAVTSATPGLDGSSTVSILDSTNAVVATAKWDNVAGGGTVSYTIASVAGPSTSTLVADGVIHTFKFSVDASGNASWALDGATKQTVAPFPAGMLRVRLRADFGTGPSWPTFLFDNVTVTSP